MPVRRGRGRKMKFLLPSTDSMLLRTDTPSLSIRSVKIRMYTPSSTRSIWIHMYTYIHVPLCVIYSKVVCLLQRKQSRR